ncbi:MAG: protein-glutamate O-methyltransferase CheR [Gemmataceae bacterium]|nr:protein-glutamate O-methyltransferase CheR [Gemmataceae bacterium]
MTPAQFATVARFLRERCGLALGPGKEYLVEDRLAPVAERFGATSAGELAGGVRAAARAVQEAVVEALLTPETSFFRDRDPFDALRAAVLPDLIQRRSATRALSVWSAGCATGQEPYSFAMLVREHFPELSRWRLDVRATDVSADALAKAQAGLYSDFELRRGLSDAQRERYFRPADGDRWRLRADVRAAVTFAELNLAGPWPPQPPADLVLLRNVLIYFDPDAKRSVLTRLAGVLRPDGYLLLGAAESPHALDLPFRRVPGLDGAFYRRAG